MSGRITATLPLPWAASGFSAAIAVKVRGEGVRPRWSVSSRSGSRSSRTTIEPTLLLQAADERASAADPRRDGDIS